MGYCQSKNDQQKINILSISDNEIRSDLQIEVDIFKYPKHEFVMRQNRQIADQKSSKRKRYLRFDVDQTQYVEVSFPVFQYLSESLSAQLANFQITEVFIDEINMDKCLYLIKRNQKQYSLSIRKFLSYTDDYAYQIVNQIYTTQRISLLNSNYLHKISHSYTIQPSNQLISNYSQLIFMEPVTTNLSFIIKNRRNKEMCWTIREFIDIMKQLIEAVIILHKNWFAHRDIRPSNIYYIAQKNCYSLGSFSNVTVVLEGTPTYPRRKQSTQYHQMDKIYRDVNGQMDDFKSDVYALGMTFLSAFYLCQPIDRKKCAPFSRQLSDVYPILKIIKGMLTSHDRRLTIIQTQNWLLEYEKSIEHTEQTDIIIEKSILNISHIDNYKRQISIAEGYKSLGIIKSWKEKLNDRLLHQKIAEESLQSAKYFGQLAIISNMQGNLDKWRSYFMRSAEIYHLIGTNNFKERDYTQAIFYFQNNLDCLNKIKLEKNNILYLRDSLSLVQAKIVSGLEIVLIQHLESLQKMVIEMQIINTPQYCIFLQQLVNIYTYCQNYFKADKYLKLLLQKTQQTRSPCKYINVQKQIIQNNIQIISIRTLDNNRQDNSILLKATQEKITKIMNQLEYYLIQHPLYKMQILFLHAKLTLIKDKENFTLLKKVESQIRDWIAHFCKLNAAKIQYQFYLLHAQVLEEIADISMKNDINKSLQLYIEAFRVYRIYFGNLYNIECALIVEKIGNIYQKNKKHEEYSDCLQLFNKILKSTYGKYNKHILRIGSQKSLQSCRTIKINSKNQFYAKFQQWQDNIEFDPKSEFIAK